MASREQLACVGRLQPPATDEQIKAGQRASGKTFPAEYVAFLKQSNGLEPTRFVALYACQDLAERNETYQVPLYAPNWLKIGDDSGGKGLFLDLSRVKAGQAPVYLQEHGAIDEQGEHEVLASSLTAWLAAGCPLS